MNAPLASVSIKIRPVVRLATFADIGALMETSARGLEANRRSDLHLPAPEMPYWAQYMLDHVAMGLVAVLEWRGRVAGMMMLGHQNWPWVRPGNPEGTYLYNQVLWVEPGARRGGSAVKLLAWAKGVASERGLPLVLDISFPDGADPEVKARFVKRCGFQYIGGKLMAP